MKIVLAPDKFKKAITSLEFCKAVESVLVSMNPHTEVIKLPLADGGDGTIEIMNYYLKVAVVQVEVSGPFFNKISARYLYSYQTKTAFIEMAEASGVKTLKPEQLDCKNATSLGTGEMILDAIKKGASKIILGIGGSATNDCGIGMAVALGYRFLDSNNKEVKPIGANLSSILAIDTTQVHPKLKTIPFSVACDVTSPLYGKYGAAYVYASQKGASKSDILMLDKGLKDFSKLLKTTFGIDAQKEEGAGAAGGMGIASKVFLNSTLMSGIKLIKALVNFDEQIKGADWIITGEGRLDRQTLSGKTIHGVLQSAKEQGIPVAAFCGEITLSEAALKQIGILYAKDIISEAKNLEDALENSYDYLCDITRLFVKEKSYNCNH